MMLLARAAMIPCRAMSSTLALATLAGTGVSRFSSAIGVTMGSPNAVTNRPARVLAAFTVTCCPRIARNPISNPLKAPGTRRPGFALTAAARRGSLRSRFAMTSGRASRSNNARVRLRSAGSTGVRLCVNSTRSACCFFDCVTRIQPFALPNCTVRAYAPSVVCSMPVSPRAARNARTPFQSYGGRYESCKVDVSLAAIALAPSVAFLRRRVGGIPYRLLNASLNRRRLEKPLAKATSVIGNVVSVRSCLASNRRRVSSSWIGGTPSSFWRIRRICRELSSNWSAIPSSPAFSSRCPCSSRCTISCAIRWASSTGALPGASSGRHRRHGRKPAVLRLLGRVVEAAVGRLWGLRRTNWPAVDSGRGDGDEEHAVEPRVSRRQRVVEPAMILVHPLTIRRHSPLS